MDELELAGLTPVASKLVKPPRVAESVVQLECKLRGTHEVRNARGESTGRIMIGEVGPPVLTLRRGVEVAAGQPNRGTSPVLPGHPPVCIS